MGIDLFAMPNTPIHHWATSINGNRYYDFQKEEFVDYFKVEFYAYPEVYEVPYIEYTIIMENSNSSMPLSNFIYDGIVGESIGITVDLTPMVKFNYFSFNITLDLVFSCDKYTRSYSENYLYYYNTVDNLHQRRNELTYTGAGYPPVIDDYKFQLFLADIPDLLFFQIPFTFMIAYITYSIELDLISAEEDINIDDGNKEIHDQ